jgi:hypothetical protein
MTREEYIEPPTGYISHSMYHVGGVTEVEAKWIRLVTATARLQRVQSSFYDPLEFDVRCEARFPCDTEDAWNTEYRADVAQIHTRPAPEGEGGYTVDVTFRFYRRQRGCLPGEWQPVKPENVIYQTAIICFDDDHKEVPE